MRFEENKSREIIGKTILIGISYLDKDGNLDSQKQLHGVVHSATPEQGILIELDGVHKGEQWNMPPDTSCISEAEPGLYQLRTTGESVENPDYLCTWEVHSNTE
ncbi:hypothetical protein ACFL48_04260 [Pseudomonadota bacterium]